MSKILHASITIVTFLFSFSSILLAQEKAQKVLDHYTAYTEAPREVAYVHLNKSTYIKGEMLGFTAYIFDKYTKTPSLKTTNLYCTISDQKGAILKKKLLKVDQGIVSNVFEVDSTLSDGTYTFRAYTNWMLNFDEQNYYETSIEVIDQENQTEIKSKTSNKTYTVEVFPEGGHLLYNVENVIGIIVKNKEGIGLGNATGKIINQNNELISEFKLDAFGIAKTIFTPTANEAHKVIVYNNEDEIQGTITDFDYKGINMSLNKVKTGIALTFRTNEASFDFIKNKPFKIAVHNGSDLYLVELTFDDKTEVSKLIKDENLFKGMNIITVFDDENRPILERQYFNFKDFEPLESALNSVEKSGDSLKVKLNILGSSYKSELNNISISVLPTHTKSYNFNSNILSKLYLEPYVKGFVQNSQYYFRDISNKTIYDLDNLLLTQGWSSYDWSTIFNHSQLYRHKFENGISTIVNINGKDKSGSYFTYPLKNSNSQVFAIAEGQDNFEQLGLFPEENEYYRILKNGKKRTDNKPAVYVNFSPFKIPVFNLDAPSEKTTSSNTSINLRAIPNIKPAWENFGVQQLDEVIVTAEKKEATRIEKIKNKSLGTVQFIDDRMRLGGMTLATYLDIYTMYQASDIDGYLRITDPYPVFPNNPNPYIILDGVIIEDFGFLGRFSLDTVDYIEVNRSGLGAGLQGGGGGYIKIVTDPSKSLYNESNSATNSVKLQFPLAFSSPKKFYAPSYYDYNSAFFKEYGTIAWFPNLQVNENGMLDFTFFNANMDSVTLNIEGSLDNGEFISETKTISLIN
jgi:hypothetical protein